MKIDPSKSGRGNQPYRPRLSLELFHEWNELQYLLHFLPGNYVRDILISASNNIASIKDKSFSYISYSKLIIGFSLIYVLEVYKLPERRLYWNSEEYGTFPVMNFGKVIGRNRFEDILKYLELPHASYPNEQRLEFLHALNNSLKEVTTPGDSMFRLEYGEIISRISEEQKENKKETTSNR